MTLQRLAVVGARGRMGSAVVRLAREANVEVVCALDQGDSMEALKGSGAQALIEFASPRATAEACRAAAEAGVAVVSGTTGLDDAARAALDAAARSVPVLWEPNMSVGVHVLSALLKRAMELLGPGFDVEIVEAHHGKKADAPSGTAMRLAEVARAARDGAFFVHGREGRPGPRKQGEIGVHAVRGGDVIGDHTVMLLGQGERLELTHKASSRDLFAAGALRAATALVGRPFGRYALADVL
jgi:4-hydroxy-tetrahydrodipicolinate reductase